MEKQRGVKALSVVALVAAVIGLTVAFAALSQTLTINGSATMDRANWEIKYVEASGADTAKTKYVAQGHATAVNGDLTATTVSNLSATLTRPGDSVTFYWDVVNTGDIDAQITALTPTTISNAALTCTGKQGAETAEADASKVCSNLVFTFKYVDGNAVAVDDALPTTNNLSNPKHLELTVTFPSTVTNENYPADDVTITFPEITTTYGQVVSSATHSN